MAIKRVLIGRVDDERSIMNIIGEISNLSYDDIVISAGEDRDGTYYVNFVGLREETADEKNERVANEIKHNQERIEALRRELEWRLSK